MLSNTVSLFKNALVRQKWIFAITFLVVLSVWLVLQQSSYKGFNRSLSEQEARDTLLIHALEDSVIRSFQSVNSSLQTLAESLPQISSTKEIEGILRQQLRVSPQLRSIDLIDAEHNVVAAITPGLQQIKDYPCIDRLLQDSLREYALGLPQPGRFPNDPFVLDSPLQHIPFCVPIRNDAGEINKILIASVNPQYFSNLFDSMDDALASTTLLYRYDGHKLLDRSDLEPNVATLKNALSIKSWGQYREQVSGQAYLISYRSTSLLPLVIVLASDEASALASWRNDEQVQDFLFVILSLFFVSLALLIAVLLEKRRQTAGDIHLLSTAIRSTANAIFITDSRGDIHWVNQAFSQLTGYSLDEVKGKNPKILNSGSHSKAFFRDLWQTILSGKSWRGELLNRHKEGHTMTVEQTVTPILDKRGYSEHFIAVHEDVSARRNAEKKALFLADHDSLTTLPNRRFFEQQLQKHFLQPKGRDIAVFFIDLDRFKEINDTMGHEAGDTLLVHTTSNLKGLLDENTLLARLGGDEFAVLVDVKTDETSLTHLAEQIIVCVAQPFSFGEGVFSVTCSIGIAVAKTCLSDPSMMLRQADMAMYRAKHDGKNTFRFFDEKMDAHMKRRVFLQQQLEQAVSADQQLSIFFQPQVEASTGRLYGAEALMRWQLSTNEWVSPGEFIKLAEETGQILDIGRWLIESFLKQIAQWNKAGIAFGKLSLNISSVQLAREPLALHLLQRLNTYQVATDQICVEITETTLMDNSEQVKSNLKLLKDSGIELSIDDFGTGYSSMSYLKAIDANHLKIDRCFIIGIGKNDSDEHIVRATITLAHSLRMKVVAEGVDSEAQLIFLKAYHCDYIQGYLFARPMPADAFEAFVRQHSSVEAVIN